MSSLSMPSVLPGALTTLEPQVRTGVMIAQFTEDKRFEIFSLLSDFSMSLNLCIFTGARKEEVFFA